MSTPTESPPTPFETLLYEKDGPIARIILNRPRVLNAHNIQMRDDLAEVLPAIAADSEVRVVVLSGAGRVFCAGADLTEFLRAPSRVIARQVRWQRDIWGAFLAVPQPMIAAMHGVAIGGGLEMALCCDIRIAAEGCRFGFPEVALGMIPAGAGTQTLPRVVGAGPALEILLTGELVDTAHAYRVGLVHRIVPPDDLLPTAEAVAQRLLGYDADVLSRAKRAIVEGLDMPLTLAIEHERRLAHLD